MTETKRLTRAQAILRVLGGMGVDHFFASPGSEWVPLWEALAEPRNEQIPEKCASSASLASRTSFGESLSTWVCGRSVTPGLLGFF